MPNPTVDLITSMPVHILSVILSLLSLKEAVRTSVLSKQWQDLWTHTAHLNLDDSLIGGRDLPPSRWARIVDHILSSRSSSVVSCRFASPFHEPSDNDRFLLMLVRSGIQKLHLFSTDLYTIHPCLFRCRTLTELTLFSCEFPLPYPSFTCWYRIQTLALHDVPIPHHGDTIIARLISSCNLLQNLTVFYCAGVRHLRVCNPNLSCLRFVSLSPVTICLKGAPRLTTVSVEIRIDNDRGSRWKSCHLNQFSSVKALGLNLDLNLIKQWPGDHAFNSPISPLLILTTLHINVHPRHTNAASFFASFLGSSPHLEELYVSMRYSEEARSLEETAIQNYFWNKQCSFNCLTNHILFIKIFYLNFSDEHAMGLMKYLLAYLSLPLPLSTPARRSRGRGGGHSPLAPNTQISSPPSRVFYLDGRWGMACHSYMKTYAATTFLFLLLLSTLSCYCYGKLGVFLCTKTVAKVLLFFHEFSDCSLMLAYLVDSSTTLVLHCRGSFLQGFFCRP